MANQGKRSDKAQGKECQAANHHFQKALHDFDGCADRRSKEANSRKCMQEHSRTCETMTSWDTIASGPRKNPQNDSTGKAGRSLGTSIMLRKLQLESNTIPARQHPEIGHAYCARINFNRCSGRPPTKQEVPTRKHSDRERTFQLLKTRPRILRPERVVWQHNAHFLHSTCLRLHDASKLFSESLVALLFFSISLLLS